MEQRNQQMEACIKACETCHTTCLEMAATHCLSKGGRHTEAAHFRLMLDCADICRAAADFMLRHSELQHRLCDVCAEVCDACGKSCAQLGDMNDCVEACRVCAQACRRMAA